MFLNQFNVLKKSARNSAQKKWKPSTGKRLNILPIIIILKASRKKKLNQKTAKLCVLLGNSR